MYRFSERLAIVAGVVLPAAEIVRRWGTLGVYYWAWLDDVFIGAAFLAAAWASRRHTAIGERALSAAYGFASAIGCASLAATLHNLQQIDPSGASGQTAAVVKALMLAIGLVGLAGALRGRDA